MKFLKSDEANVTKTLFTMLSIAASLRDVILFNVTIKAPFAAIMFTEIIEHL